MLLKDPRALCGSDWCADAAIPPLILCHQLLLLVALSLLLSLPLVVLLYLLLSLLAPHRPLLLSLYITADAVAAAAAVAASGVGNNIFLSAVLVSAAVVPSVYWILYFIPAVVNETTVPLQTPSPTVCFATVRLMNTLAHSLQ